MPILIVGRGSAARVVEVESDPFTIGRSPDCHLVLEGSRVSRQHGELTRRGSRHVLRDRGSQNGTRINGRPIEEAELAHGDEIRIGDTLLVYSDGSDLRSQPGGAPLESVAPERGRLSRLRRAQRATRRDRMPAAFIPQLLGTLIQPRSGRGCTRKRLADPATARALLSAGV